MRSVLRQSVAQSRRWARLPITAAAPRLSNNLQQKRGMCTTPEYTPYDPSAFFEKKQQDETKDFIMQQTMIRVKDPERSLKFYIDTLGFHLVSFSHFPQWGFSVFFVAYCDPEAVPKTPEERFEFCMKSPACIEITHNHGSEVEPEDHLYNTGNSDTVGVADGSKVRGGFGHIGITVPDVYAACARLKEHGVEFTKTPNGGGMKGLAFIKDPDGYLVEILPQGPITSQPVDAWGVGDDSGDQYKDNSK